MDIIITALALTIALPAALLAAVIIGIHQQERGGDIAGPPPGACAAIARKVLAVHSDPAAPRLQPHLTAPPPRRHDPAATAGHVTEQRPSAPSGARS